MRYNNIFLLYFQDGIWLLVYCFEWNYVDKTKNKIQDNNPYPRVGIGILKTVQTNIQAPVCTFVVLDKDM